jgi:hypothetical protein
MDISVTTSQSGVSLASFPKDSAPVTVIFGNQNSMSRRSSTTNRDSFLSLYDNERSKAEEAPKHASKIIRSVESAGFPTVLPSTSMFVNRLL